LGKLLFRIGALAARRHWVFIVGWLLVAALFVALVRLYGTNTSDDLNLPGSGSQAATDLLASRFPPQQNGASPIVFHTASGKVTDASSKQAIEASRTAIVKLPHVYSATDPFSQSGQGQISKDGKTAFIPVLLDVDANGLTQEVATSVLDAAEPARAAGMQVAAGGSIGNELSEPDAGLSEVIGITAAMIIMTIAFGSIVAMGMPILTALVGLVVGLAGIGLLGHLVSIPSLAPTIATMIGLGVGIDYALFIVSRHRDLVRQGKDVRESISLTVATTGSAVVYAGGTVVIALLALSVAGIPLVASLGYAAAVAVVTAVLAAITLLPALLALVGTRIDSLRVPAFLRPRPKEPGRGLWARWGRFLTAHPWLAILGAVALLTPLEIPAFTLQLGQKDIGAMPESTTQRQAYDLMAAGFGVGYNGPLLIAVELGTPATPSSEYDSQLAQAQSLQKELEQEQTEGTTQKDELVQQSNALKAQQAELEQQAAELERKQTSLESQFEQVTKEQAALRSQGEQLAQEAARLAGEQKTLVLQQKELAAEARVLARQTASTTRALGVNQAKTQAAEAKLARATDRKVRAALELELRALGRRERRLEDRLAALGKQEQELRTKEQSLRARQATLADEQQALADQGATLASSAAALASESVSLLMQAQQLQQQQAALQLQASQLQTQAAQLQTQQAQLEGLQQQATTNQQQAEQLKSELTAELTAAGGDDRGTDPRLVVLQDDLGATLGVVLVSPPQINKAGDAATFTVIASTAPSAPQTADLVRTLRTYTIPQATAGNNVVAYVGGSTASNVDLAAEITSRLPLVILTVIALSFLVLMAAYRSLVVPAQAALANLLAVSAAFGVLTALFQWGWGLSLLGIDTAGDSVPIVSYVPLMMFAVLFGLSMDYQVFLLTQVQHHREVGLDPRQAVASGVAIGAPVIVSAALIMIAVFGSFVLNGDPVVKEFGVGLAVGVALAASSVLALTPAILVIVGKASWWLPERVGRLLPRLDIEGATQFPEPAPAPEASAAP
jgi:uncharacterized membrane protein YdfJ with MMPL/SSD domain